MASLREWHGFEDSVRWRLVPQGVEIEGSGVERSGGRPTTVTRVWETFGDEIDGVAKARNVPVPLLIATICTESGGNPDAVRLEPGYTSDQATPHRVSVGLTQTLISTARQATGKQDIDREWLRRPRNAIDAGAVYIAKQARTTRLDPPLVAAAYNAGTLAHNTGARNRWKLRQFPIGTSAHCDRFVKFYNDAVAMLATHSRKPSVGHEILLDGFEPARSSAPAPRASVTDAIASGGNAGSAGGGGGSGEQQRGTGVEGLVRSVLGARTGTGVLGTLTSALGGGSGGQGALGSLGGLLGGEGGPGPLGSLGGLFGGLMGGNGGGGSAQPAAAAPDRAVATTGGGPGEVRVDFGSNANPRSVTPYSLKVLKEIVQTAGLKQVLISSTSRPPAEQARVMFNNLEKYGVAHQKQLYAPAGQQVIDVYAEQKAKGASADVIKAAMERKIVAIGPTRVSRHASDPQVLNVFDVAPSSIRDRGAFEAAVRADKRVAFFLTPPKDPGYHLEIPQPK